MNAKRPALNLLIYPSPLTQPDRITKIARSLHIQERLEHTEILGVDSAQLPARENLTPGIEFRRIREAPIRERLDTLRLLLFWQMRVYQYYQRKDMKAVAVQNLSLLPMVHALVRGTSAVFAYNAHGLEIETVASKDLRQKTQRLVEKYWIYKADLMSVVNEPIGAWYRQTYPGTSSVTVTNSPLDAGGTVDLRERPHVPEDHLLYIHIDYLAPGYSIPLLLEVFMKAKNVKIVFLGDGVLRTGVKTATQVRSNIHQMASVAPEEVVSYVRGADVSLCLIEGLYLSMALSSPNKLMESLAAQAPPLCSDLIEARRLLGERASTQVLEDVEAKLADAIARISHKDVEAFKASFPSIPTWEDQVKGLEAAYSRALEAKSENRLGTRGWSRA